MATLTDAQILAQYPIPASVAGRISDHEWAELVAFFAAHSVRNRGALDYAQGAITAERHVASSPDIYPVK
jgi:hypothetical protein